MSKMLKGALIGGAIGVAAIAIKAYKRNEPVDVMTNSSLKTGGQAALAGAVIGGALGWRDKRKAKNSKNLHRLLEAGTAGSGLIEVARVARPSLEHAFESMVHAADLASPHVQEAAGATKAAAIQAAVTAKPHIENAAKLTRKKADLARSKAFEVSDKAKGAGRHVYNGKCHFPNGKKTYTKLLAKIR